MYVCVCIYIYICFTHNKFMYHILISRATENNMAEAKVAAHDAEPKSP